MELDKDIKRTLKHWVGLYRSADLGCLYQHRSLPGSLGLTSNTSHFENMQVIKCSILLSSPDPKVTAMYEVRAAQTTQWRVKWSAEQATSNLTAAATLTQLYPAQTTRRGLGHGDFIAKPTSGQFRAMVVEEACLLYTSDAADE